MAGSKDGIIFVWRVSQQKNTLPTSFSGLRGKKGKKIAHACEEATEKITKEIKPLIQMEQTDSKHSSAKMADFVHQTKVKFL